MGDPILSSYVLKCAGEALLYVGIVLVLGYILFNEREV
jgi:hypothetical protein